MTLPDDTSDYNGSVNTQVSYTICHISKSVDKSYIAVHAFKHKGLLPRNIFENYFKRPVAYDFFLSQDICLCQTSEEVKHNAYSNYTVITKNLLQRNFRFCSFAKVKVSTF